jgi:hypothetical protein
MRVIMTDFDTYQDYFFQLNSQIKHDLILVLFFEVQFF